MDKFGVQLYSFGMDSPLSFLEKIRKAGEIGYTGVEFAGGYDDYSVEEVKKVLDEAKVSVESAHVGLSAMEKDIPFLAELGVKYVICPMEQFNNAEEAKEIAVELNKYGKLAAKYGMKTGYHNHTAEFYKVDGKYLYDWLIESCDPEFVEFQLDCGWASAAGVDPVEYINAHKGRICSIHMKENGGVIGTEKPLSRHEPSAFENIKFDDDGNPILPEGFKKMMEEREKLNVPQGSGIVDWNAVKKAADAQHKNVIYVVEREVSYGGKDRVTCLSEDYIWVKNNM